MIGIYNLNFEYKFSFQKCLKSLTFMYKYIKDLNFTYLAVCILLILCYVFCYFSHIFFVSKNFSVSEYFYRS